MQKILLTGLLILLLAVPAPAAEKEVAGVFFPLPEGWSVVEENTSGTTSTLLLRQEGRRNGTLALMGEPGKPKPRLDSQRPVQRHGQPLSTHPGPAQYTLAGSPG